MGTISAKQWKEPNSPKWGKTFLNTNSNQHCQIFWQKDRWFCWGLETVVSFFSLTSYSVTESHWCSSVNFTCDKSQWQRWSPYLSQQRWWDLRVLLAPEDSQHTYAQISSPFCWREKCPQREGREDTLPASCCSSSPSRKRPNPRGQSLGLRSQTRQQQSLPDVGSQAQSEQRYNPPTKPLLTPQLQDAVLMNHYLLIL